MLRSQYGACALLLFLAGCVPTEFPDLRGVAPTLAVSAPSDYAGHGFGRVVIGYSGSIDAQFVSRFAISAGEASAFAVHPLLAGDALRLDARLMDGCNEDMECGADAGISLLGLARWGDREVCLAAPSPEAGEIRIRCEDDMTRIDIADVPNGQRFGEAGVGLPDHPLARAIIGAPGASAGRGAVYRWPDRAAPVELDLSEASGLSGELGSAIAAAIVDDATVLVASAAPLGPTRHVVVATSVRAGDGSVTTRVRDCIPGTTAGFGRALAIGDLDGDGALDVVVGSALEPGRLESVRVYAGRDMPAEGTCDGSWPVAAELECPASMSGVACDALSFGSALASGDVDGDGTDDLLVGAPGASVDGLAGAGAVYVFRGAASLTDLARTIVALRTSSPAAGAALGTSVATGPGALVTGTHRRAEPIAGAPGVDRVYLFLCSGLDGDSPDSVDDPRCQP